MFRLIKHAVSQGMAHRGLEAIESIGVDGVRAREAEQMKADGYEPILKHSRWSLMKRREN